MSQFPDSHRDLLEAEVGILSTVGDTGIPHTTAVWFLHDDEDGELKSWLSDARQKVKNLMKRPEFSFFILDVANPARYLAVRGRAELAPDPDCVFGERVGKKYHVDVRRLLQEGETRYVVTFKPLRIMVR
ncbi:MAG TPA: pyridoxamine 5'-phosphate oxidase family protein [Acidimicrobiales bacterium]|nr:pyridoxamine 5'-phosphate oxidase family protein [Acidimicrobiales bacterium]